MRKKILSIVLLICMVMTLLPTSALAAGPQTKLSGSEAAVNPASVITPDAPEEYVTFLFYNGEELVNKQVVKLDGVLVQPATPKVPDGSAFLGWFVGETPVEFGAIAGRYNGGETVTVTARFTDVLYVYFMTVDSAVYATGEARAEDWTVTEPDYRPAGQRVTGWFYLNDAGEQVEFNPAGKPTNVREEIGHDVQVFPHVENCYWVSFNSTGGSKVGSVSVAASDTLALDSVEKPVRTGYSFKGWSLSENGAIVSSVKPENDLTLFAVWEGVKVNYTVVYWGENADDTNYSVLASTTKSGKTGTTVSLDATSGALPASVSDRAHFSFKSSETVTVSADGSSVLNVYFSRKSYKLTFKTAGTLFTSGKVITTVEAKYDSDIAYVWETNPIKAKLDAGYVFQSSVTGKYYSFLQKMPNQDITMTEKKWSGSTYYIYYYLEILPGQDTTGLTTKVDGGKTYYLYHTTTIYATDIVLTYEEDYFPITGFAQRDNKVPDFKKVGKNYEASLYYLRSSFKLSLNNYGSTTDNTMAFEAALDSYENLVPARPAGFSENAVFKGWYEVPPEQVTESTLPFGFAGKTMPAKNLMLYAYWEEQPVTLTVIDLAGKSASAELPIGTVIASADIFKAVPSDGILRWVYEDLSEVNVNEAIFADTVIRAVPIGVQYTVSYDTLTEAVISDSNKYEFGAKARVMDGSGLEKDGKVFACWTDGEHMYYPGSFVLMGSNVKLTAVYVERVAEVSLSYHANFPAAAEEVFKLNALTMNGTVSLLDYAGTGLSERKGYEFVGWSTAPQGEAELKPGDSVRLDGAGANELYAVWSAKDTGYKVEFYYQKANLSYSDTPSEVQARQGKTDSSVSVTEEDKLPKGGGRYVFDEAAANVTEGIVNADGTLVLKLYFKLDRVSYTVRYLWHGSEEKAAEPKTVEDITVGTEVTEAPIDIEGYSAVSNDSKKLELTPDAGQNVIVFYYYKNVTLEANSASFRYDGSEKSVSGFSCSAEEADFSAVEVGASGTVVGEYPAVFAEGTVGSVDASEKYIVTAAKNGKLVITPCTDEVVVTITGNSAEKPYNGAEQKVESYTVTSISDLRYTTDCFAFEGSAVAAGTDAGEYAMGISDKNFRNVSPNFDNVRFVVTDGALTIKPLAIELTAGSDSKEYDGNALTCGEYTISSGAFVEGEGLDAVTVEGSQTLVGSSDNVIKEYKLKANTKAVNYVISLVPGKLTVTDRSELYAISVEANSASKMYDGEPITAEGFKALEFTVDGHVYTVSGLSAKRTGTNVSDSGMVAVEGSARVLDAEGNDVTAQFKVSTKDGELKITARSVELVSGSAARQYNGLPLTNDEVTVKGDGFVKDEGARYFVTGSQTQAGQSDNEFSYELRSGTLAENYVITTSFGTLTVTPVATQLVVKANDANKMYDGSPLTAEQAGYSLVSGELAEGDVLAVELSGSQLDAGKSESSVKSVRVMRGNEDVTASYIFGQSIKGELEVTVRSVTITSGSDEKVYDGKALTNSDITVSGDGFAQGEGASYVFTGSQTDVGTSDNEFTYTLNEGVKAANYVIKTELGSLTVKPVTAAITVTAASGEKLYDGTPLTNDAYRYTQNVLAEGETLVAVVEGSQTDAGSSDNLVKSVRIMRGEVDVTGFYTGISTEKGTLTVKPRSVKLISQSDDKVYDGTALTRPEVTVEGDGFVEGEVSDIKATGSITEVGSVSNSIVYTPAESFKADNYVIELSVGTLTVTASEAEVVVYITGAGFSGTYDGTEKTAEGYTVTKISSELYTTEDFTFTGNAKVSATDAGSYMMGLSAGDFENKNDNFANVTFVVTDGKLEIAKRAVKLVSASDEKEYDGKPLMNELVTVTGDGFVEGEVSDIKATGSITMVGSVSNSIVYTPAESFKADNYSITEELGTLSVKPSSMELKVTANSNSWVYDGQLHGDGGYTVTYGGESFTVAAGESVTLPTGDKLSAVITVMVKDVADTAEGNNIISKLTVENAEQYANIVKEAGTLAITAKPLSITAGSAEKTYDGKPLTSGSYTATELAEGDMFDSVKLSGSQTNVGESGNVASAAVIKNEKYGDVTANYAITYIDGVLKVNACEDAVVVTITERGGDYKYDGGEKKAEGYDVAIAHEVYSEADFEFSGDAVVSGTDAGSYEMMLKPEDFKNINDNFTNVSFVIVDAKLNIAKRDITMTSGSGEKTYDGKPLMNDEVTVTGDGFVEGEGAVYMVTGSQLDAGESDNEFTYTLSEGTKAENYEIKTELGTLRVLPVKTLITVTAGSAEKMYDGTPLTNDAYGYTEGVLVSGDELSAVVEGSQTDAGKSANVVKSYRVMRGETDVTANYSFAPSVDGELSVTKRSVIISSGSGEKIYDGTPLTNDELVVTGDGFIKGEGAEYEFTGSQTNVGESDNEFTYTLNEGTKAENYEIKTEFGTLKVLYPEQEIVITAGSAEKLYDGKPLTAADVGYSYTEFVIAATDTLIVELEGEQLDAGESASVVKSYRVMRDGEDVTANYLFADSVDGLLTVTKRQVTLASATHSKMYDGKPLVCHLVRVSGDGFAEAEGADYDITGSQTEIGMSNNDFTYKLWSNTKAENYEITVELGQLYVRDKAEKPTTGDSSNLLMLLAAMAASGSAGAVALTQLKKRREEE